MGENQRFQNSRYYFEGPHTLCRKVVLSDRAYVAMLSEAHQRITTETGGILLGHYDKGIWYVVEIIDPGMKASYSQVEFQYDGEYVTHLLKKVARLYKNELHWLGVWHRHPGSMDRFSSTDDDSHKDIVKGVGHGAVSILVNFDPEFRISTFYVDNDINYWKIDDVKIGDQYCIPEVMELCKIEDYKKHQSASSAKGNAAVSEQPRNSERALGEFIEQYALAIKEEIHYYSSLIDLPKRSTKRYDSIIDNAKDDNCEKIVDAEKTEAKSDCAKIDGEEKVEPQADYVKIDDVVRADGKNDCVAVDNVQAPDAEVDVRSDPVVGELRKVEIGDQSIIETETKELNERIK